MKMNIFFITLLLSSLGSLIPITEAWVDLKQITPFAENYLSLAVQNHNKRARFVYKATSVTHAHKTMASVKEYVDILFQVKETICTSQDFWKDDFELNKCEHKSNGRMLHCRACFSATNLEDIFMHGQTKCVPKRAISSNSPLQSCEALEGNVWPKYPNAGTLLRF